MKGATILMLALSAAATSDVTKWTLQWPFGRDVWSDEHEIRRPSAEPDDGAYTSRLRAAACEARTAGSRGSRPPANDSLLRALREGGLVIVLRHAITDHSHPDAKQLSRTDRSTQRNLSEAGIEQSNRLGDAIRALRVPVDEVYSSPLFRTMDTAINAFGRGEPSEALWRDGTAADRQRLLSEPPGAGKNRVLVTHNFLLISTFAGLRHDDVREGDAIIVRPLGDGRFDVLGRFPFAEWTRLAAAETGKHAHE